MNQPGFPKVRPSRRTGRRDKISGTEKSDLSFVSLATNLFVPRLFYP